MHPLEQGQGPVLLLRMSASCAPQHLLVAVANSAEEGLRVEEVFLRPCVRAHRRPPSETRLSCGMVHWGPADLATASMLTC